MSESSESDRFAGCHHQTLLHLLIHIARQRRHNHRVWCIWSPAGWDVI